MDLSQLTNVKNNPTSMKLVNICFLHLFIIYYTFSKKYKKLLTHKKNEINRVVNTIPRSDLQGIIIEDLNNVKKHSKLSKNVNNKMQYWSYRRVIDKLGSLSQEEGFFLLKVNPAYTSQTCSNCGELDKSNRHGEIYQCKSCNIEIDADYNASINVLRRGIYSLSTTETNLSG